jgi:uncharacterized protein DUF4136
MKYLNLKKIITTLVPLGAILIIISSCYPNNGTVYNSSLDTVLTLFDESVDFTQFKTYSMPDTIINICDDPSSSDCIELEDRYDAESLALIAKNLEDLGYTRVFDPETNVVDLFVFVSKIATKNAQVYSYPWWGYWGWYPGWGYPGYPPYPGGGWNPWYPWGGTVVYTYTTGSMHIEMISTEDLGEDAGFANSVWAGGMNGLLEGSDIPNRIQKNINQIFAQSPYLKTN